VKLDGSLSYKGAVTPLQKVMMARRSFRKYSAGDVKPEQLDVLRRTASDFAGMMGFSSPRIMFVTDAGYHRAVAAAFSGIGRTNPWLPLAKSRAMIVAACRPGDAPISGDKKFALAETAMTMEAVVLSAAGMGLATCWMSAINHKAVEQALGLGPELEVIAVSPLGLPPEGVTLLSWDGVVYHLLSKRRRPLSEILFEERLPDGRG
jgi:nitroreductase